MLVVALVSVGYRLDIPTETINFLFAAALFGLEIYQKIRNDLSSKSVKTLTLKSKNWMGGVALTAILIFHFSDEPMNILNIVAITVIVLTGLLNIKQNLTLKYAIDKNGIRNLFTGKLLDSRTITSVVYNSFELTINTANYQNELVIKSSNLIAPTWNELTTEIKKLENNSGLH